MWACLPLRKGLAFRNHQFKRRGLGFEYVSYACMRMRRDRKNRKISGHAMAEPDGGKSEEQDWTSTSTTSTTPTTTTTSPTTTTPTTAKTIYDYCDCQ